MQNEYNMEQRKEILENLKNDERIRRSYLRYLNKRLFWSLAFAGLMHLVYYILYKNLSKYVLGAFPTIYLIIFWIPFQFLFLAYAYCKAIKGTNAPLLSNYQYYRPRYRFIYLIITNICACTPSVIGIMIFKFDENTRTFNNFNFWKVQFIYAPLVIIAMFIIGRFWGMTPPYQERPGMPKADWYILKQELSNAGLDPNKVPIAAFSEGQLKSMSKADWYNLGMDLEIVGYDIKKHK